jgi:hypothetical protein
VGVRGKHARIQAAVQRNIQDRQTDGWTDGQNDRQTYRQTDRQRDVGPGSTWTLKCSALPADPIHIYIYIYIYIYRVNTICQVVFKRFSVQFCALVSMVFIQNEKEFLNFVREHKDFLML